MIREEIWDLVSLACSLVGVGGAGELGSKIRSESMNVSKLVSAPKCMESDKPREAMVRIGCVVEQGDQVRLGIILPRKPKCSARSNLTNHKDVIPYR